MPGIAGIFGRADQDRHAAELHQMVDVMLHEPTYSKGTYSNPSAGIYLGWVAHAGSFADAMPAWSKARDVCLIFAGEDFSGQDSGGLNGAESDACSGNDASYLVHCYEAAGLSFLERLNGWFSGVVVDFRHKTATLFNDRYGLHRVHCHEHASGFYFGSEAKSLLCVMPKLREIDPVSLGELFSCGATLDDRTLFRGVTLLPGAARWTYASDGRISRQRYFKVDDWERQPTLSNAEYCQRFEQTFKRILPRYLRPGNGLAMSLTGGLDGRMIMAVADAAPGALPCYTFGGEYRDCADVRIARTIAKLCGQEHQTVEIGSEFCAEFAALAEKSIYISDGTMDVTGSVEIYANRLGRRIAPIRLTGNYGSEIVRGNIAFRPAEADGSLLSDDFQPFVQSAARTYEAARRGDDLSFIAFKQVPWHHYARFSIERSQLTPRSPYLDNDLVALMYQAPRELRQSVQPSLQLIVNGNAQLAAIPTDRGVRRNRSVVGASRAFLDELSFKAEYAYDYGMPQWLVAIDRALSPMHLERWFLGRHKFYHFRVWYRDRLASYVREILLDPRSRARPYLKGKHLEVIVNQHTSGTRNHTTAIHQALTAEFVHRLFIDRPGDAIS